MLILLVLFLNFFLYDNNKTQAVIIIIRSLRIGIQIDKENNLKI